MTDTEKMAQALRLIVEWRPPQVESRGEMVSMGVAIGSNGVRDYFRRIAQEAIAAHDAARAQPASVPDGWQPIETAPRDGTMIIAAGDSHVYQGRMDEYKGRTNRFRSVGGAYIIAALWMPMPSLPKPKGEKARKNVQKRRAAKVQEPTNDH